jgi:citronellol/citronellal dehydrogenase
MRAFQGKTVFISGASRGIGKAIGLRLAREGANIVVAAKTAEPHPKLHGTIHTAAEEMEAAGGRALPVTMDLRFDQQVRAAAAEAVAAFGGIDILINNASAIALTPTEQTEMKRYDLMHQINLRGTFLLTQCCLPYLKKSSNPHILTLSPPIDLAPKWLAAHLAYTISKYGMSMCVLGWAQEYRGAGVAANALWPRTTIATAAIQNLLGGEEMMRRSRRPEIVADAAYYILRRDSRECTGNLFLDEDILVQEGITEWSAYAVDPDVSPMPDLFLES